MNPTHDTQTGSGLLVPVSKLLSQLTALHMAIIAEWDMDHEFFINTVREHTDHINNLQIPSWMTADALNSIELWKNRIVDFTITVQDPSADEEAPLSDYSTVLYELIRETWGVFQILDHELVGLPIEQTDAGQVI